MMELNNDDGVLEKADIEWEQEENDELIIEENTIYEIDLECFECWKQVQQQSMQKDIRK